MATHKILHRDTGAVIYEGEGESLRDVIVAAVAARANLADADLVRANLAGAASSAPRSAPEMTPEERHAAWKARTRRLLAEIAAEYRARHPEVPVVERLDAKILAALELDMSNWHLCDTTHCRAGWAIHLAGDAGYALEKKLGSPARAGRAIYLASTGDVPYFHAGDAHALADIKRCATRDQEATT